MVALGGFWEQWILLSTRTVRRWCCGGVLVYRSCVVLRFGDIGLVLLRCFVVAAVESVFAVAWVERISSFVWIPLFACRLRCAPRHAAALFVGVPPSTRVMKIFSFVCVCDNRVAIAGVAVVECAGSAL